MPSRLSYSGFDCCVHTRKHTCAKKKKKYIRGRLTVDEDKTRARMRVSVILVDHFGGKTIAATAALRSDFTCFVFSVQTLLWQGNFTINFT